MKKVDFFIVGAPKSGTTFLKKYISQNSKIFMPKIEPIYFCRDMNDLSEIKTMDQYLSLFGKNLSENNEIVCGEKSSNYLYSDNAYEEIYNHNPNAKIIICLRNPVEAVVSFHNHNKIMGFELINSFLESWRVQELRKSNNYKIPYYAKKETMRYQYKYIYSYDIHVKKFIEKFGYENVKIIIFDEMIKKPQNTFNEIFDFLKVEKLVFENIEPQNVKAKVDIKNTLSNSIFRFLVLYLKTKKIKVFTRKIKNIIPIKSFGFLIKPLKKKFYKLDVIVPNQQDKFVEHKELLIKEFRNSLLNLSKLIKKNLDYWMI
tara:strand:- start:623 stop:1570 length:948 start_codon:yes stop_codon:yes gene_type:complete